jgi:hypothetical protein
MQLLQKGTAVRFRLVTKLNEVDTAVAFGTLQTWREREQAKAKAALHHGTASYPSVMR